MKRSLSAVILAALMAASAAAAQPQTWTVDPVHSFAQFTAKHFDIVPVVGTIPIVDASVRLDPGSEIPVSVSADLDPSKVDTHDGMRDGDLRSPHFFDVAAYPKMHFASTKITGTDPKRFTITGDLTMRGQTHPVTLNAQVAGAGKTPRGRSIIAYSATATIQRSDWGMTYGPVIVGNSIDITLNVEAEQQ